MDSRWDQAALAALPNTALAIERPDSGAPDSLSDLVLPSALKPAALGWRELIRIAHKPSVADKVALCTADLTVTRIAEENAEACSGLPTSSTQRCRAAPPPRGSNYHAPLVRGRLARALHVLEREARPR